MGQRAVHAKGGIRMINFDEEIKKVKAVIRTGGYWLHAPNVILQAGCTYDE